MKSLVFYSMLTYQPLSDIVMVSIFTGVTETAQKKDETDKTEAETDKTADSKYSVGTPVGGGWGVGGGGGYGLNISTVIMLKISTHSCD